MTDEAMRNRTDNTCRQAWRLRRQVLCGLPTKGNLIASVAANETSCKASEWIPILRGERISAGVLWVQPCKNGPSGLANAAHQNCPPGVSRRASCRLDGHRSRWGADQPGPEVRRGDAASINDLQRERHMSPGAASRASRRAVISSQLRLGGRTGVWSTIRTVHKPAMTSPSGYC